MTGHTPWREIKPTVPFTDEDRARLESWRNCLTWTTLDDPRHNQGRYGNGLLLTRTLAYIDHLEGALESVCNVGDRAAVQVARAALPTSKDEYRNEPSE